MVKLDFRSEVKEKDSFLYLKDFCILDAKPLTLIGKAL
jgi:hypothetical protein